MYVSLQKIKMLRIMKELFFNTIQEFNDFIGVKTLHPLVSIARVENTSNEWLEAVSDEEYNKIK